MSGGGLGGFAFKLLIKLLVWILLHTLFYPFVLLYRKIKKSREEKKAAKLNERNNQIANSKDHTPEKENSVENSLNTQTTEQNTNISYSNEYTQISNNNTANKETPKEEVRHNNNIKLKFREQQSNNIIHDKSNYNRNKNDNNIALQKAYQLKIRRQNQHLGPILDRLGNNINANKLSEVKKNNFYNNLYNQNIKRDVLLKRCMREKNIYVYMPPTTTKRFAYE